VSTKLREAGVVGSYPAPNVVKTGREAASVFGASTQVVSTTFRQPRAIDRLDEDASGIKLARWMEEDVGEALVKFRGAASPARSLLFTCRAGTP
jgi:hypothetical protein